MQDEAEPTDRTALESVVDHVKEEIVRLQALEERILSENGPDDERLQVARHNDDAKQRRTAFHANRSQDCVNPGP